MKYFTGLVVLMAILAVMVPAQEKIAPVPELEKGMQEYTITAFDRGTWIVTARESATSREFKFYLPPEVFKGQTFSMEGPVPRPGMPFVARGPRDVRMDNMVVRQHIPGKRMEDKQKSGKPGMNPLPAAGFPSQRLDWEIVELDSKEFIVRARNEPTHKIIRFRVNPECFIGMRFLANPGNLLIGASFQLVVPNRDAFKGCCTMLE